MRGGWGWILGGVRLHHGGEAEHAAAAVGARAFSLGSHVAFGRNHFRPESGAGRLLLGHEVGHVLQQQFTAEPNTIRRDDLDAGVPADADTSTKTPFQSDSNPNGIDPSMAGFPGISLTPHYPSAHQEMRDLIVSVGRKAPSELCTWLRNQVELDVSAGVPDDSPESRIWRNYCKAAEDVTAEADTLLMNVGAKAKDYTLLALKASETQVKAEELRYGMSQTTIKKVVYGGGGHKPEPYKEYSTVHGMESQSPSGKGLQAAANVLLRRQAKIDLKIQERDSHYHRAPPSSGEVNEDWTDSQYEPLNKEVEAQQQEYNELRSQLCNEYPILASFSELGKDRGDLETIATKGPGADAAAVLGAEIGDKLAKIAKVREGLADGDVNPWRLEAMVGLAKAELGVAEDPVAEELVQERVKQEEPGIFGDLALLVVNIAALALAGPTGGISLAVAAGVNVAVGALHVQDYIMQSALSGTHFDRAQALSKEDPSLFWLAVEIVGAVVDVSAAAGAVARTFRSLRPVVKAAAAVKEGEAALESLETVRIAAKEAHGAAFAEKVVAQTKAMRGGEAAALKAAGATDEEIQLLRAADLAAGEEAATGIGKSLKTATGEVSLGQSGRLYSCASPCLALRDKYAEIFVQNEEFMAELRRLESEANRIAEASKTAKASGQADELAKVNSRADKLKEDAAALETRIQQAHPSLAGVPDETSVINAAKQAEAESAITKGRLPSNPAELEALAPKGPAPPGHDVDRWEDYIDYFNHRLECLKAGKKGVKPPLSFANYSEFLGKFRRGTKYQEGVLEGLRQQASKFTKEGEIGPDGKNLFGGMENPIVESNVAVLEKTGKRSIADKPVHNFPDQVIVDGATIGPNKTPKITTLSNKSHDFDKLFKEQRVQDILSQVSADVEEAVSKYGEKITLKRPTGPLASLYGQTLQVDKVVIVYDRTLAASADVQELILQSVIRPDVQVIFR